MYVTLNTINSVACLANHTLSQACAFNQQSHLHEISASLVIAESGSLMHVNYLEWGSFRTQDTVHTRNCRSI